MSEPKISDGGRGVKDPAAKLPETVGFAPRGGLRRDGQGGERSGSQTAGHSRIRPKRRAEAGGAGRDKAGGMTEEVGRERGRD